MIKKKIHLVSFDVPYPANYGGVIDVYFKIKALKEAGIGVILHCFTYNRSEQKVLDQICDSVFYYPRYPLWRFLFSSLPLFVGSRAHPDLLKNLVSNDFPILFEGIHCCAFLGHPLLLGRKQWVRLHNQETNYYSELAKQTKSIFKKVYYRLEASRIPGFEPKLAGASGLFVISESDKKYYLAFNEKVEILWPFHGYNEIRSISGMGKYVLYHANFSVSENQVAADWLLENLSPEYSLVLAGSGWTNNLLKKANKRTNSRVVQNPGEPEMEDLIKNAQVVILPTFQTTGVKLKLLQSLFHGRHILVNPNMLEGTHFHSLCHQFRTKVDLNDVLKHLINREFTESEIQKREEFLKNYSDHKSVQVLLREFGDQDIPSMIQI
ncbi:MAG TPA: glycosyltransferase [Catalimonadaceae bacterium]|nr:glycosyltransferase [Catalimonadaceae bacterium]